jgi:hypothetical protein
VKRGTMLCFAVDEHGTRGIADALDLDEQSFRVFLLDVLWSSNALIGIDQDSLPGDDIALRVRPGAVVQPADEPK